jgi:hypothetical protein
MKKTLTAFGFLALFLPELAFAQAEPARPPFGIAFSGFIKTDILYDTRQTVSLREGHYLLYPKPASLDRDGADINARDSFHMLSVQTRLLGRVWGPDALGAKTSGLIEGEFFGTADGDTNGFRLRHAIVKLNWPRTELMVGQYWHPLFVTESFPEVVSFDTGAPFQPFNRSPQVRLTRAFGRLSVAATVLAQRDFVSNGPDGASSVYLRNARLPELNLRVHYGAKDDKAGTERLLGAAVNYLRLAPRLVTETGYATDEAVGAATFMAFAKARWPRLTAKAEAVWSENAHHLTMIGGYAVRGVPDQVRRVWEYAPLRTLSFWSEVLTNGKTWQAGLFAGYAKNLGASEEIAGRVFARGADIADLVRISPRLVFNAGQVRFAAEIEATAAAYGIPDSFGRVRDGRRVTNVRFLLGVYHFF